MPMTRACPDLARYQCLASGLLSSPENEALLSHLASCDACAQRLEGLVHKDTLVELIRQAQTDGETPQPETVARLVERLRKLRPKVEAAAETAAAEPTGSERRPGPDGPEAGLCECLAPAQSPDELGRLGPYRVLQVLGAGGMGVVYRAEDPQLKRPVALKAILPKAGASESARKRFQREAQAAAAITHDNIVQIYQVGEDRGVPFMAMQFLDGESLEACLKRERRLPAPEVVRIGRETAEGLAAAHEHGLIHRDIKPPNLWLEGAKRRVKILDFGVARAAGDDAHLTQPGAIIGTPAYMAPEQAGARPVDQRCDLFSLGCVLYRMATGAIPFKGNDTISILAALAREDPPAPASLNPDVPAALSDLVMWLLQKDPVKRPASAQEVVETLAVIERTFGREFDGQTTASTGGFVLLPSGPRSPKRRIAALAAAAVVLLCGSVAAALIILRNSDGDYVIETDDADFVFQVNRQGGVTLEDRKAKRAYQMNVLRHEKGEFDLQVADDAGQVFEARTFVIRRGEKVRLKAWFARKQDAPATTQQGPVPAVVADDWMKEIAAMPPDRQVKAVMDKLKALNPGFDGKETHAFDVDGEAVIELHFCTDKVADISPLRALTRLQKLSCAGTLAPEDKPLGQLYSLGALKGLRLTWLDCSRNGQLTGLGPLKGMPLVELNCNRTKVANLSPLEGMKLRVFECAWNGLHEDVSDLSPLEGMPLEVLNLCCQRLVSDLAPLAHSRLKFLDVWDSRVRDLAPLKGLPLTELHISYPDHAQAYDLTPLKGLPLEVLYITAPKVADLSLLKDMPLKKLKLLGNFKPERDAEVLRSIKTLETINDKPVEHVLGVSDAWVAEVSGKPGPQQLQAVMDKLKEINAGFDGKETHAFDEAGKAVIELSFCTDKVTNISPVRGLAGLQKLRCTGTHIPELPGQLHHLGDLKGLKLTLLDCSCNGQLSSLDALQGMPLTELVCSLTKVSDLAPLKGMKLTVLRCQRDDHSNAYVSDLAPLEGMPLEVLDLSYQHRISDLSPLAHSRLKTLGVFYCRVRNLSPLTGLPLEGLGLIGNPVTDLTPLQNIQSLKELDLTETPVKDLSPLKGLRIKGLRCISAHIEDLTPLKGMPLEWLDINRTRVSDLAPLKGMPLKGLRCGNTQVSDLGPLRGMQLEELDISPTKVADLSPLKEMPLKRLWCDNPDRDAKLLRSIKALEFINDKPAKEVLK